MSIQPDSWFMDLSSMRALEDCDRWKVDIFAADDSPADPPQLIGPIAAYVSRICQIIEALIQAALENGALGDRAPGATGSMSAGFVRVLDYGHRSAPLCVRITNHRGLAHDE